MAIKNPIKYVSRTFNTILNDINSDSELVDKPNWFKRIWAGIGDVISIWLNAQANNSYLRTAFTRQAVKDICELIDYDFAPHSTATGAALFYVKTDIGTSIFPFTVSKANLKGKSIGNLSVSSKTYEARADVTFTLVSDTFTTNFASNNNLTLSTDLQYSGHKVRLATTGTLPAPLQINTDYYVIYKSATTIALATSLENAYANNEITLTSNGTGTHTLNLFSKAVTLYQQDTLSAAVNIGTSDGTTEWQEFNLPDSFVLKDTLEITINSVVWTRVDTFVNSIATDKHYKILPLSDNQFYIRFGNGVYGAIPGNFDIYALYSYGGGTNSNISSLDRINSYAGNDSNLTGITNPVVFTGGANEEGIESAKLIAPLLLKARDVFVRVSDGEALVLNYGGISNVKINRNKYGVLSCQVIGIANGGGNPSPSLRAAIQQYLIDRSVLSSIDVRFEAATITSINVTSALKVLAGYSYSNIEPYFELAYKLLLTEAGREIYLDYISNGIESAVTLINSIFSASFDDTSYTQIRQFLDNLEYRNFNDTIQESDIIGFIDSYLIGCDYLTITTFGTGFPLSLADNEITTPGTLTLSEIT